MEAVYSKWKINMEDLQGFVIGSDKKLYRLGYVDNDGHFRKTKNMKLNTSGNSDAYFFTINSVKRWFSANTIVSNCELIPENERIVLFEASI